MFFKHNNLHLNFFSPRRPKHHPRPSRFAVFIFQVNDLHGDLTAVLAVDDFDALIISEVCST